MKIYYLKYYKGNIKVEEYDNVKAGSASYSINNYESLLYEDEGKILEYSLGDIRIWITERGDFKLAYNKLRDYVIKFHNKNIKYLNGRISEEEMFLDSVQLLAIK